MLPGHIPFHDQPGLQAETFGLIDGGWVEKCLHIEFRRN
jgi:hypothetical protein